MAAIRINPKSREDWLEERKHGIGASEVSTVLGINPFETPYQLWRKKRGLDAPQEETMPMKLGHLLEDSVAKLWEEETGRKVIANTAGDWLYVDEKKPFLRVSPDRLYWLSGEKHNAGNRGILECKTTQKNIDPDDIPKHWFCQVQMNLGVSGLKHGSLAWLSSGRTFGYVDIEFDAGFYNELVSRVEDFWTNNVLANVPPIAVNAEDLRHQYPEPDPLKITEVDEQTALACDEYKTIKQQIAELETRRDEIENNIKMRFTDGEAISYGGLTLATWKTSKSSMKFDAKSFTNDNPQMAAQYMREVKGSRRFCVK